MNEKISWYLEKENAFLGKNILAICYHADENEIKEAALTNKDILILINNSKINEELGKNNINIKSLIERSFSDEKIFLRLQYECLLGMYGDLHCDCEEQRKIYLEFIKENGGVYIHLPQEAQGYGLFYKLKELELQVNGFNQNCNFTGQKDRNTAFYEINNKEFKDLRKYSIIKNILEAIGIVDKKFILLTESRKKVETLLNLNIKAEMYDTYIEKHITKENASEYLIKILDGQFDYNNNIIYEICNLIKTRGYNERTINTFLKIIEKIKNNNNYLNDEIKTQFLEAYDNIICGIEKSYNFKNNNIIKVQNKFSCKVDNKIFGIIKKVYKCNIFSRIAFEKNYLFKAKTGNSNTRIRHSYVLDINENNSFFMKGQEYLQQSIFEENTRIIENEITKSKLQSYFENKDYIFEKKIDMITFISENILEGVNVYIKRLPNFDNHIMDVYGKKENILKFIEKITILSNKTVLDSISNIQLEDENNIISNLSFSDINTAINEEKKIFNLLK